MRCPEPSNTCHFCYNEECFATHWYECAEGYRKLHEGKKGNKNNRYCQKQKEE